MEKKLNRMKELVEKLSTAARAYYSTGDELISNKEYDELYAELEALENETGVKLANSPVGKVGYEVVSSLAKVQHEHPALSLAKTKEIAELLSWLMGKEGVLSYKLDGLTIVATYNDGDLVQIASRGNGVVGENLTHLAPVIRNLPQHIPCMGKLVVRGECIISYEDFNKVNETMEEPYKNPRNLASGSLRLLDAKEAVDRGLQFVAFSVVEGNDEETVSEQFAFLSSCGFKVVEHWIVDAETLESKITEIQSNLNTVPVPTDGLVLAYNDRAFGISRGTTGHHPNHSIAFKWQDEVTYTTLKSVEWSASKTGLLNPVAVFEPVEIEGTTVQRASVHNLSVMRELGLGLGNSIGVIKANLIIPQVVECVEKTNDVPIPTQCPVCGHDTERKASDTAEFLYCTNPECAAKHIGTFERLTCRDGLDVVGLAGSAISEFVSHGWLGKPCDIYHLEDHANEIMSLEGFGKKSYDKLIKAVEDSRNTTFKQFFYSLGIHGAGHDVAKILEKNLDLVGEKKTEQLSSLLDSPEAYERLVGMSGIGSVTAEEMIRWFANHKEDYRNLLNELTITDDMVEEKGEEASTLEGLVFVITGSLNSYPNRDALKAEIESKGGKVSGSVSKNTSFLINNDIHSTSGKNKKAMDLGVRIISEEEYKNMF